MHVFNLVSGLIAVFGTWDAKRNKGTLENEQKRHWKMNKKTLAVLTILFYKQRKKLLKVSCWVKGVLK